MTDNNDISSPEIQVAAKAKKQSRFNHAWWLPLIALLMVSYIAINHFTTQGPMITITFNSAEGLEAKKTKVKYKDVIIGEVEKISLNPDYNGVKAFIRMDKSSQELLRQNTRFWVIKPRIGITQVTGLNTLLSGNYITIEPDKNTNSDYRYDFTGLETPPIISEDEAGLRITLLSSKAASLYPGTAIYYKGMEVGTVNRVYFSDDYLWVKADVFIAAPHDKLIKQTTKFWSSSGISIDAGANGVEVAMESVETLIAGGISFDTPVTLSQNEDLSVENGTEYILFANKKSAEEQNTGRKRYFVTYFNGSIKGLDVGSPVMVQGMKVGKVKDIRLMFDAKLATTRIPILFEIYEDSFNVISANSTSSNGNDKQVSIDEANVQKLTTRLIKEGLKTQLETGNLLTGSKNIALVFDDSPTDSTVALVEDPVTGYTLLPSTPQSFDALTSGVTSVVNKVNNLPLDEIAGNLNTLLATANGKVDALPIDAIVGNVNSLLANANDKVNKLSVDDTMKRINQLIANTDKKVNQLALEQTVKELNALLNEGQTLSKTAKSTLKSLNDSVDELVNTTGTALAGYSADAPLYHNLNLTLEQLNDTLGSLQAVTDMLDRHPNALVFGEDKPAEPQQSYWESNDK